MPETFNWQIGLVGLQLRILNGVVSLLTTTRVENKALAAYLSEQGGASGDSLQILRSRQEPMEGSAEFVETHQTKIVKKVDDP
jgi:hypothetical protein